MERWLAAVWYADAPGGLLLRPLAWLYAIAVALRRFAFRNGLSRTIRVARPVIVVGNLTVGGSGKTPLVIWLADELRRRGRAVAVISRGYGRRGHGVRAVTPTASVAEVGDEALLIARRTGVPVVVGRDRVAAARLAIELGADVIVSDDGLQHLRLARDFEVAVIDGARGLGNGRLLPAGPLREPARRLASVSAVVVHGTGRSPVPPAVMDPAAVFTMQLAGAQLEALRPDGAARGSRPLSELRGAQVHAVAGIGHPQRFFAALRAAGLVPIEHAFPDHHAFVPGELAFGDTLPVVMTEKDAVKCSGFGLERAWVLPVSAEVGRAAELVQRIDAALEAAPSIRRGSAPREA